MKRVLMIIFAALAINVAFVAPLAAQETQPIDDPEYKALKQRQQELIRQLREEAEKQNKILEEQLAREKRRTEALLKDRDNATSPVVTSPNTSQPATASAPEPQNQPTPVAGGNGTNVTGGSNAASVTNPGANLNSISPVSSLPAVPPGPLAVLQVTGGSQTACALILATPRQYSRAEVQMCGLAQAIVERRMAFAEGQTHLAKGIDPTREDLSFLLTVVLAELIRSKPDVVPVNAAVKSFVVDVEAGRADKQLGADPRASGTTSLGVKGGIPQVLSWGVENGAAVASRDGTTVTFRVNPVGAIEALSSQGYITSFTKSEDDAISRFFRRTSAGFSFDTTRGTDPPTLIGSKQQLSAVSVKYQVVNKRDPRHKDYRDKWNDFFSREALDFTAAQTEQFMRIQHGTVEGAFKNTSLQNWLTTTNAALNKITTVPTVASHDAAMDEVRTAIQQQLAQLPADEIIKDFDLIDALNKSIEAYGPYLTKKNEIMDEISKGTVVAFEYTNYREPNAPDLSNFRFIAEKGTLGGIDLTANASLTFFNKRPIGPSVKRIRDYDFSAQFDKRLDDVMGLGPATLSFTGKFQRLTSNAIAFDGTVLPNTKGDIAAGQIKLTIPIKDSGIKLPFSFTFANRTELVRERETRGNFGFTFDLDTLFARFKAFTPR